MTANQCRSRNNIQSQSFLVDSLLMKREDKINVDAFPVAPNSIFSDKLRSLVFDTRSAIATTQQPQQEQSSSVDIRHLYPRVATTVASEAAAQSPSTISAQRERFILEMVARGVELTDSTKCNGSPTVPLPPSRPMPPSSILPWSIPATFGLMPQFCWCQNASSCVDASHIRHQHHQQATSGLVHQHPVVRYTGNQYRSPWVESLIVRRQNAALSQSPWSSHLPICRSTTSFNAVDLLLPVEVRPPTSAYGSDDGQNSGNQLYAALSPPFVSSSSLTSRGRGVDRSNDSNSGK